VLPMRRIEPPPAGSLAAVEPFKARAPELTAAFTPREIAPSPHGLGGTVVPSDAFALKFASLTFELYAPDSVPKLNQKFGIFAPRCVSAFFCCCRIRSSGSPYPPPARPQSMKPTAPPTPTVPFTGGRGASGPAAVPNGVLGPRPRALPHRSPLARARRRDGRWGKPQTRRT